MAVPANRPRLALWLKWRWWLLRWLPCGGRLWSWADGRVDAWHARNGR